jgi:hypothetical protein
MVASLIALWAAIGTLVIAGPAALDTKKHGPFCEYCNVPITLPANILVVPVAISGYWCWISSYYPVSRITCVNLYFHRLPSI